jgi:hypothetical protein
MRSTPSRSIIDIENLIRYAPCAVGLMEIEHLIRSTARAVGLKPSAVHGEARLRGLERIISQRPIRCRMRLVPWG